ncbi:MAG: NAD(P)/FAD-dependent oxidoreductase [Chloroflexota bacterium]
MYDVIVVGGGPVGSRVAHQLAVAGYQVLVVEAKERLGEPVCCTGIISLECVNSFAIDEGTILRRVSSARIFSPSGKVLNLRRDEPQACIVDRALFDAALARRAQDKGVEYRLGSPVKEIKVNASGVRVGTGSKFFEAKVAVITTGFGSKLTEGLGLSEPKDFIMGAQTEVEVKGLEDVEVYLGQDIAPGFFAWLVPTSPGKALAGLLSRKRPSFYLTKLLSSLEAQGKVVASDAKASHRGVPLTPLSRTCGDHMIVVGTAAGQVKPTTGGGIYFGLLCADIAADCLVKALARGDLSRESLADYEKGWKKLLSRELRTGYQARRLCEQLSDRRIDQIFDIMETFGIDEALTKAKDVSFDWHGKTISKLLGHWALSKIFGVKKFS